MLGHTDIIGSRGIGDRYTEFLTGVNINMVIAHARLLDELELFGGLSNRASDGRIAGEVSQEYIRIGNFFRQLILRKFVDVHDGERYS